MIFKSDNEAPIFYADMDFSKKQEDESGNWIIEGYASTSDLDLQGDVIDPGALKSSEQDLLENSTVLFNHDGNRAIGRVLEARYEAPGQLWVKVLISKTATDIWTQVTEGVLNKFSIRGRILSWKDKWNDVVARMVRVVEKMSLMEVSLVPLPANPKAKSLRWYVAKALDEFSQTPPNKGGNHVDISKNKIRRKLVDSLVKSDDAIDTEGTLTRSLENVMATLSKMAAGDLSPEDSAAIASDLQRSLGRAVKDVSKAEARLIDLETEKAEKEAEEYEKALEAKMAEIAANAVAKALSPVQEKVSGYETKIADLEKSLADATTREDELTRRFEAISTSLEAIKKAKKPLFAENPAENDDQDPDEEMKAKKSVKDGAGAPDEGEPDEDDVEKSDMLIGNKPKSRAKTDNNMKDAEKVKIDNDSYEGDGIKPVDTNKGGDKAKTDNNMKDAEKVKIDNDSYAGDGIEPVDTNKSGMKDAPKVQDEDGITADTEDTNKNPKLPETSKSLVGASEVTENEVFLTKSNWGGKTEDDASESALDKLLVKAYQEYKSQRKRPIF